MEEKIYKPNIDNRGTPPMGDDFMEKEAEFSSKRFIVNKIRPVKSIFTYVVEANNEEEALNKALKGDFLSLDKELEEFDTVSRYDVYEEGKG